LEELHVADEQEGVVDIVADKLEVVPTKEKSQTFQVHVS
jgi:hypothetical protein